MISCNAKSRVCSDALVPILVVGMGSFLDVGWMVSSVRKTITAFLIYMEGGRGPKLVSLMWAW